MMVMIITITTTMMTMRMTVTRMTMRMTIILYVTSVLTHTASLSLTDDPRKCDQASITMTAPNAPTNIYGGVREGASLGTPSSATNSVPL